MFSRVLTTAGEAWIVKEGAYDCASVHFGYKMNSWKQMKQSTHCCNKKELRRKYAKSARYHCTRHMK